MAAKCTNCLRGARLRITGVNPSNTLRMDMGGAVLYVMPRGNKIEVVLNSENLKAVREDQKYKCFIFKENAAGTRPSD